MTGLQYDTENKVGYMIKGQYTPKDFFCHHLFTLYNFFCVTHHKEIVNAQFDRFHSVKINGDPSCKTRPKFHPFPP